MFLLRSIASIKSVQLGCSLPIFFLQPTETPCSYYKFQLAHVPTYLQITTACYFNPTDLANTHAQSSNSLQPSQQIDSLGGFARDGLQALNAQLLHEISAFNKHSRVRILNTFEKMLKKTRRIFI
jgi:hypothetical protein